MINSLNTEAEKERICDVARLLQQAAQPIRILKSLQWEPQIKANFLAKNATELPQVHYEVFDPQPVLEQIREARRRIFPSSSRIDQWLDRQSYCLEWEAQMLANVGNPAFLAYGRQAYGDPTTPHS